MSGNRTLSRYSRWAEKMIFWAIYDISSDKVRNRIISKCKNYGMTRVQKSSFIGDLSRNRMEMLAMEIKDLEIAEKDCIFFIPNCKGCYSEKEIIGRLDDERVRQRDFFIFTK